MIADCHVYRITTFTGKMLLSGLSSEWLQRFINWCLHGMAPAYLIGCWHNPANVQQISSKRRAISTCILNTFAGRLLDRVNGVSLSGVRLSLRQQVVLVSFGPLQPATWSYHAADCQPTPLVLLVLLVQPAGTL